MQITEEVLGVLRRGTWRDDLILLLPEQVDRVLYTRINTVLEAHKGSWSRKEKGHVFPDAEARERLEEAIEAAEYEHPQKDRGEFFSPPRVVERVLELARLESHHRLLEPSAGKGALLLPAAARVKEAFAVEINKENYRHLLASSRGSSTRIVCADFLHVRPIDANAVDRIVMNPPFGKDGGCKHVQHATTFLHPSGLLVAVMPAGILWNDRKPYSGLRELIFARNGEISPLPEGSFTESGTDIETVVVTLPGPAFQP